MSTTVDLGKITASVTVGTTTTGAAGTNASVSNSGTTQDAVLNFTIPRGAQGVQGPQGSTGPQGPAGPTGPQGPMGDVAVITPEQQAAFTMYSEPGQNTNGPMTQKAVTDAFIDFENKLYGSTNLYQKYKGYNVNTGKLTYGTDPNTGTYRASQEINLSYGQNKVEVNFTANAFLFYDGSTYKGWNQTGIVIDGSTKVVIGLRNGQLFDDTMLCVGYKIIPTLYNDLGNNKDGAVTQYFINQIMSLIVGLIPLHQEYQEYNVHTGKLTYGTDPSVGSFKASQKIPLVTGQTKVITNFPTNAFLFYDENDVYKGWNQTGIVIDGSTKVVIGLRNGQLFDGSMSYMDYNGTYSVYKHISELSDNYTLSWLKNKTFAVIGDSLSENHVWENRFAQLTGAEYIEGYSKGGEATLSTSGNCGMDRALKLLNENPNTDIIFIQNINDMNISAGAGNITDLPYMMTKNVLSETVYPTFSTASNALATEISSIPSASRKVGTMLRIQYGTNAKKVKIANAASNAGTVIITIGSTTYGITVTSGMSVSSIQSAILSYDYTGSGFSDTKSGANSVLFTDTLQRGSSAPSITIDSGGTGITFTITDATSVGYFTRCFISKNINDWNDTTKWVANTEISRYQLYKGLISWLQTNFPNSFIFMLGLPRYSWNTNSNSYKYADGTYDWDSYRTPVSIEYLFEEQKTVSQYMRIKYLDVVNECGISVYNANAFYPANDVHPTTLGYTRWGETVARLMQSNFKI